MQINSKNLQGDISVSTSLERSSLPEACISRKRFPRGASSVIALSLFIAVTALVWVAGTPVPAFEAQVTKSDDHATRQGNATGSKFRPGKESLQRHTLASPVEAIADLSDDDHRQILELIEQETYEGSTSSGSSAADWMARRVIGRERCGDSVAKRPSRSF